MNLTLKIEDENETKKLAEKIATQLSGGEVICLIGDLGAGKTHFVKYLGEALGIDPEEIISPTFVYWREHEGKKLNINHFDFYRISSEDEVESIGLQEALEDIRAVTIIEWADKIKSKLPEDRIVIRIKEISEKEREFSIRTYGERYKKFTL